MGLRQSRGNERGTYITIKYHGEGAEVNLLGSIRKPLNLEWRNRPRGKQ
jgi:hypothetical protein